MHVLPQLLEWQKTQSQKEGVEGYMVLPFKTLRAVAEALPQTEEDLLHIKGIGPAKARRYGRALLAVCAGTSPLSSIPRESVHVENPSYATATEELDVINALLSGESATEERTPEQEVYSSQEEDQSSRAQEDHADNLIPEDVSSDDIGVGEFLTGLNGVLTSYFTSVRVRGEVIGFKHHASGHAYFEVKDASAVMRCSVFRGAYERSGITLADGMEVIITGAPQHHARYGFSFIGEYIELAGEGALQKAYNDLKKKLTAEGLCDVSRKRSVPEMPERVGLITSATGAAIGDFMTNVGSFGYHISFVPSLVEGAKAVKGLLEAIEIMKKQDVDVLVIVRGGGSLESLQAFNNENVVRALAEFPVPVIAGVGHEQDETLTTLVADKGVSTPTAAARAVRAGWDQSGERLQRYRGILIEHGNRMINQVTLRTDTARHTIMNTYEAELVRTERVHTRHVHQIESGVMRALHRYRDVIARYEKTHTVFTGWLHDVRHGIARAAQVITAYDPARQLARGYSIAYDENGKVIRRAQDVRAQQKMSVQFADDTVDVQKI